MNYQVMVPILLLNMLIAMMGNTYAQVILQSEKEFVKQVRLQIHVSLKFDQKEIKCNFFKNQFN